ncbi:hypothetical protein MUB24_06190 [Lederbergia sp. NSJ-179]|uniref:hypothetical protein n=1 Tax=Lederbergia sp. NSJ-179 TaxID=2931402 RepID=UPI001FCF9FD7|nr:hypothetical protein [Lederbergia sp. NSJ-179]MCJ7840516.1 hypothetical protein [Lederbergia sp. NSJ-179]
MEKFEELCNELKKIVTNAWEQIKEILENIDETISEIEKEKCLRSTWYVPKKIIMNHQVMNRKPLVAHIRNSI